MIPRTVVSTVIICSLTVLVNLTAVGCAHTPDRTELVKHISDYVALAATHGYEGSIAVADVTGTLIYSNATGYADRQAKEPFQPETAIDIGSNSKAFAAAAFMLLVEEGKVDLTTPISIVFPNISADKTNITFHHLLTHASGLPDEYTEVADILSREEMENNILAQKLLFAPGTDYSYSDIGYAMVAAAVERISKQPYRDFVAKNIFEPLGLRHTGFVDAPQWQYNDGPVIVGRGYVNAKEAGSPHNYHATGWSPIGPGPILSTSSDGIRWISSLIKNRLLSETSMALMFKPHIEIIEGKVWYGYGWNVMSLKKRGRVIAHSGASTAHNYYTQYLQDIDLYIVTASNKILGTYKDANGDGYISDDEIAEETIFSINLGGNLARAIYLNDWSIMPDFMKDKTMQNNSNE